MEEVKPNTRIVTLTGYSVRDAMNVDLNRRIAIEFEEGFELVSCNMTSCENYNTIYYGVIMMFKKF